MFKFFKRLFRTNPRKKGRRLAMAALLAFNGNRDAEKFIKIKNQLTLMIQQNRILNADLLQRFQMELAEELKVNPLVFAMVFSELMTYIDPEEPEGKEEMFQFLRGIVDAISIVYPGNY